MKETRNMMGMHITVEIIDKNAIREVFEEVFSYFTSIDKQFSTYKNDSEIMRINRGEISALDYSKEVK
jgi:FAD:protein FMN transferase